MIDMLAHRIPDPRAAAVPALRRFGMTLFAGALVALAQISVAQAQVSGFSSFVLNGGATDTATALTLTDNNGNEARSGFSSSLVNYGAGFTTSFTYTPSGNKAADGIAFILQNDSRGTAAVGALGGALGYGGSAGTFINNSAAVELNIFASNTVGSTLGTNGTTGPYTGTGPVSLASGDPIVVTLTYSSSTNKLTEMLSDSTASTTYSTSYTQNLATVIGGSGKAYVGFSGGTGGSTSTQTISNFSYTGTAAAPEPGSVALLALGMVSGLPIVGGVARRQRNKRNAG